MAVCTVMPHPTKPAIEEVPQDGAADAGIATPLAAPRQGGEVEFGGRGGPDPTRYGDWEKNGRCIDF